MFNLNLSKLLSLKDPKLEFKNGPGGLNRLKSPDNISPTDPYWEQYFDLFSSSIEVLTILDSFTLEAVLAQNPQSLITLVKVSITKLQSLLNSPGFPHSSTSPTSNNTKGLLGGLSGYIGGEEEGELGLKALNAIRVLSRIIPFLPLELQDSIFWSTEEEIKKTVETVIGDHFIIDDEDDEALHSATITVGEQTIPLAKQLLSTLVDLQFIPGFSLDSSLKANDGNETYTIWTAGVASAASNLSPPSISILSTRLEILRLFNILLALPTLSTDPISFPSEINRWREAMLSNIGGRKVVLCFLCSLLNTGLSTSVTSAGAGMLSDGIDGMREKLGGVVLNPGRKEVEQLLITASLQSLGILLIEHALPTIASDSASPNPSPINNFSLYSSKLHRPADLEFMFNGITAILFNSILGVSLPSLPPFTRTTPGNSNKPANVQETLIILTRLVETNKKFLNWIFDSEKIGILCRALMGILLAYKDDAARFSLMRLSAFLLQTISAEKNFGLRINESSIDSSLGYNSKFGVVGSMGDFFVVSIYTLIFTTRSRLSSLYPSLLLCLNNLSPYFKALTPLASIRLVQLFLAISTPSFILMEDSNPRLVFYLLETLEQVVRYQLSDNPYLIYFIIRSSERFEFLSTFTAAEGIADIRAKKRKRSIGNSSSTSLVALTRMSTPGSPSKSEIDLEEKEEEEAEESKEEQPTRSEKSRGKMRERSNSNLELEEEEDEPFVGLNGFIPTEKWVASWREHLPLDVLLLLIVEFREKLSTFSSPSPTPPIEAINFLKSATLIGLLPPAQIIKSRAFKPTIPSNTWTATLVYGSVYLGSLEILRAVDVRFFRVGERGRGGSDILSAVVDLTRRITG